RYNPPPRHPGFSPDPAHTTRRKWWCGFSGSADKGYATVRDRYGQLLPQCVPPARRRSFSTDRHTDVDRYDHHQDARTAGPRVRVPESLPARFYTYIQSRPGHRYSPNLLRCRTYAIPSYLHGYYPAQR